MVSFTYPRIGGERLFSFDKKVCNWFVDYLFLYRIKLANFDRPRVANSDRL